MDSLVRTTNFTETEKLHKSIKFMIYSLGHRELMKIVFYYLKCTRRKELLALKCLFYLGISAEEGESFRVNFRWLAQNYPAIARRNLANLAEYGRYDDLYCVVDTPVEKGYVYTYQITT